MGAAAGPGGISVFYCFVITIGGLPITYLSESEYETEAIGERLGRKLKAHDIVALFGGMGAGKTAFVRGLGRGLEISSRVSSPTFSIVNEYEGPLPLIHFDLYRLRGADELFDIGWEDYLEKEAVIVVEWSQLAPELFEEAVSVTIEAAADNEGHRLITVRGGSVNADTCH